MNLMTLWLMLLLLACLLLVMMVMWWLWLSWWWRRTVWIIQMSLILMYRLSANHMSSLMMELVEWINT